MAVLLPGVVGILLVVVAALPLLALLLLSPIPFVVVDTAIDNISFNLPRAIVVVRPKALKFELF